MHNHAFNEIPYHVIRELVPAKRISPANGRPYRVYDPTNPQHHYYEFVDVISPVDGPFNLETVAKANRLHPAPGMLKNTIPVFTGKVSLAQLGYGSEIDDFGPVKHTVLRNGKIIKNETLPSHRLHPGYVIRAVYQLNNIIYMGTLGEGIGALRLVNENFSEMLWTTVMNGHIRYRVSLHYRQLK